VTNEDPKPVIRRPECHYQCESCRRHDAPDTPHIKDEQFVPDAYFLFAQEEAGYHVSTDDKEDIDADEPSGEVGNFRVSE
jgi:hypothetical protein